MSWCLLQIDDFHGTVGTILHDQLFRRDVHNPLNYIHTIPQHRYDTIWRASDYGKTKSCLPNSVRVCMMMTQIPGAVIAKHYVTVTS